MSPHLGECQSLGSGRGCVRQPLRVQGGGRERLLLLRLREWLVALCCVDGCPCLDFLSFLLADVEGPRAAKPGLMLGPEKR